MIRFKDGQPEGIYYSQHRDGASYSWDHSVLSKQDGRVCDLNNSFGSIFILTNAASRFQCIWLARQLSFGRVSTPFPSRTTLTHTHIEPVTTSTILSYSTTATPACYGTQYYPLTLTP